MALSSAVLLMDIGGTNTRARIVTAAAGRFEKPRPIASRVARISDKHVLLGFISGLLADPTIGGRVEMAVLSIAGPVAGDTVSITNWPEPRELSLGEFVQAGLPQDRTILLNDMEAAAHCLMAHKTGHARLDVIPLYSVSNDSPRQNGNSVLIIPGTGVGIAGLIALHPENSQGNIAAVPCEVQHTAIPALDAGHEQMVNALGNKLGKLRPSWEDFVSGKGLENIYDFLVNAGADEINRGQGMGADEIAERAILEADPLCRAAMDVYYRCAGALAQLVALSFQAFGGIYLAGESTRKNLSFIKQSHFLTELHNNTVRYNLLKMFPVYLVAADLNLDGAAYIASRKLQSGNSKSEQQ